VLSASNFDPVRFQPETLLFIILKNTTFASKFTSPHLQIDFTFTTDTADQDKAIALCYKILSTSGVTGRLRVAREVVTLIFFKSTLTRF
jgi:hypothetical protein